MLQEDSIPTPQKSAETLFVPPGTPDAAKISRNALRPSWHSRRRQKRSSQLGRPPRRPLGRARESDDGAAVALPADVLRRRHLLRGELRAAPDHRTLPDRRRLARRPTERESRRLTSFRRRRSQSDAAKSIENRRRRSQSDAAKSIENRRRRSQSDAAKSIENGLRLPEFGRAQVYEYARPPGRGSRREYIAADVPRPHIIHTCGSAEAAAPSAAAPLSASAPPAAALPPGAAAAEIAAILAAQDALRQRLDALEKRAAARQPG